MGVRWIALGLGMLLVGILGGYLMWGRPTRDVVRQVNDLKTQVTEERGRAAELESKLAGTEAELNRAAEAFRRERELREKFEDMVNKGRK
jgi:hypothetical protein